MKFWFVFLVLFVGVAVLLQSVPAPVLGFVGGGFCFVAVVSLFRLFWRS
ncbi:hypothetical protein UFOVP219_14 [uncultured Caudovirales phage]|uniref:Uncharacterized protein n=1 Tax=uncultured Caudovirales phage TaxID=2100421 RepID=A0A6J7WQM2_9CAUD|nr:hypothetical protein UFOVP219_14 [uncultured Caudovirales phage]